MMAEQIVLPFRLSRKGRRVTGRTPNDELVGLSYFDGVSETVVTSVCPANPKHVLVERESDGKTWAVPAGLIRLIVRHKKRRRIA